MNGLRCLLVILAAGAALPVVASAAPPANDDFASAQVLSGQYPIVVSGTTREATREPGDPASFGGSVWYRWTPAASGRYALEFCAENLAAAQGLSVSLYTGETLQALQEVYRVDLRPPSGDCPFAETDESAFNVYDLVGGTTYRVYVGGSPSMQGRFGLVASRVVPPPNDQFADATVLDGSLPVRVVGSPRDSTDGRLWYRWTARASGPVTLEECSERPADTLSVEVLTGSSESTLRRVPTQTEYSNVSECPFDRGPVKDLRPGGSFKATRGTTYVLRVAADPFYGGRFGFALKRKEVYDLAVSQSVSRKSVPAGGVVVEKLTVTNRSNITVPPRAAPRLFVSQSINRPALHSYAGKGRYLSVRAPGVRCSKGFFVRVPVAGCSVKRLAPGERMVVTMRIRVLDSIFLEVETNFEDDRRGNNEPSTVVRARR